VVQCAAQVLEEQDAEPLVMCVDDDEVNHIVLEGMLHSQNYRCATHKRAFKKRKRCVGEAQDLLVAAVQFEMVSALLYQHISVRHGDDRIGQLHFCSPLIFAANNLAIHSSTANSAAAPCRYVKARSGSEALSLLDTAEGRLPHLVLLDTALPDTTGLDVLQQIRGRFNQIALPVVMLTARHNEKAIVAALDSGANDYAVKPFRRSELLARIRMHLRSSQKAAATAAAVTPMSPVAAALAAADEGLSQQLQELLPAAQQLKQVPLLVAQLEGLEVATAGLAPEQLSQLLGTIADTFDAVVEKYAVLKVRRALTGRRSEVRHTNAVLCIVPMTWCCEHAHSSLVCWQALSSTECALCRCSGVVIMQLLL
jgi:CheY-like chemotaxis protein